MKRPENRDHGTMLIVNPAAGGGLLKKKWKSEIHPFLKKTLGQFDHSFTKEPGHATVLTRTALNRGFTVIGVLGGDGTLNEAVNGFFDGTKPVNPHASLAAIPFASGGDFIRTLGMERDYRMAVKRLLSKRVKKIDVGLVTFANADIRPRYFVNIAEAGLGAVIMKRVNRKNKNIPSFLRYLSGTLQGFFDFTNIAVRLILPDKRSHEIALTNLIVANGQYFGYGMRPAPHACLDDGLFDVIVLKNLNPLKLVQLFPQIYLKKKSLSPRHVEFFRTNILRVEVLDKKKTLYTEMDGETHGHGDQTFTLVSQALNVKI